MFVVEKSFHQIWRELSKQGWKYKKPTGLSNDTRYLPPTANVKGSESVDFFKGEASLLSYCRRQGWLALPPLLHPSASAPTSSVASSTSDIAPVPTADATDETAAPPAPPVTTSDEAPSSPATVSNVVEDTTINSTPASAPADTLSAAAAPMTTTAKKKPARKSTDPLAATGNRKASTNPRSASKKQRRSDSTIPDTTEAIQGHTEQDYTDTTAPSLDHPEQPIPDTTMESVEAATHASRFVSLDDFDSDNFLDALKRDRLFGPLAADDLNLGESDWQRALDSDTEGDEDGILFDEANCEKDTGMRRDERSDDVDFQVPPADRNVDAADTIPIEFDLTSDDLDRLQREEWDTFDEHHSNQVLLDAAPLYEGPTGPTRAALAYAENPLAIFYFFLPKVLWRKIAAETNQFRRESINSIAEGMRARALERRRVTPSTVVLALDEYKTKLLRKHPIQPHELVRFVGLLIARTLETRRESLSRHWLTKAEGALSRGTFGQFLSRDRFQDIARYMHFNDNSQQADSGDRAYKIRPVLQALQKTFWLGYRFGSRISFDEGMAPMRHRRNPMR